MTLALASIASRQQAPALVQGHLTTTGTAPAPQLSQCSVYIGAELQFSLKSQKVAACFRRQHLAAGDANPATATHFFLFITDSFLKSKEHMLSLITLFAGDPNFKQRLFPVIMDQQMHIFQAGEELPYADYWNSQLVALRPNSVAYRDTKIIADNIAAFIRAVRDTLMPPLDELLQNNLTAVTEKIEQRAHLPSERFFFLPKEGHSSSIGQEAALLQLSEHFVIKPVVSLSGEAGMGKTTLAIEYAKRSGEYTTGIYWLDASNRQSLEKSWQGLATQLGTGVSSVTQRACPHAQLSAHLRQCERSFTDSDNCKRTLFGHRPKTSARRHHPRKLFP